MSNTSLNKSRAKKDDEFYTRYADIENELKHYWPQLKNKRVYCNCDNPFKSQFIRYFLRNFNKIGLKELMATSKENAHGYWFRVSTVPTKITNEDEFIEKHTTLLMGDGGFETTECVALLDHCDVVITNPPFSKFMDWYTVVASRKPILVVMNSHAFMYSTCVLDTVKGKFKCGYTAKNGHVFDTPSGPKKLGYSCWGTTLKTKPNPPLTLTRTLDYGYKHYDGYDNIIEVSKLKDIPKDYKGQMGVPFTYILHHCPTQFKILGKADSGNNQALYPRLMCPRINGKVIFKRWIIQRIQ